MTRGRKPKPEALHKLAGNPGKRKRDAAPELELPPQMPAPPEHLSDAAQALWLEAGAMLHAAKIYTDLDAIAFATLCEAYALWLEAEREMRKTGGPIVISQTGNPIQNPWLAIAAKAVQRLQKLLVEFGMTPSARQRVKIAEPEEADPFDSFLAGPANA